VRGAEIAIKSEQAPAAIAQDLEGSKWGALVTVLRENGLNAGQIITIVLALITVIFMINESLEPQPRRLHHRTSRSTLRSLRTKSSGK
jgi:hypothetical protein